MKNRTEPGAWGFLSGAYFFLMFLVLYQLACVSARNGFVRQQTAQTDYSVKVTVRCDGKDYGAGSGVLIGGRYALTAEHVVDCPGRMSIVVSSALGAREAFIDKKWSARDIARLRMIGPTDDFWGAHRPHIAPLEERDVVCTAVRSPQIGSACGWITGVYPLQRLKSTDGTFWSRTTTFNAEVAPGNSGGALYNAKGDLVALVTGAMFIPGTTFWFQSSYASELQSIREELFE